MHELLPKLRLYVNLDRSPSLQLAMHVGFSGRAGRLLTCPKYHVLMLASLKWSTSGPGNPESMFNTPYTLLPTMYRSDLEAGYQRHPTIFRVLVIIAVRAGVPLQQAVLCSDTTVRIASERSAAQRGMQYSLHNFDRATSSLPSCLLVADES